MNCSLRIALAAGIAIGLVGCVGWTKVPAKQTKLAGGLSVTPENEWSSSKYGSTYTWTVHGPSLEAITVVSGLADGKSMARPANYKDKMPLFRSSMAASEVAELAVESLLRIGYGRVELLGVQPETFAGRPGFRFELELADERGLEKSGFGAGAVVDGKLYLVLYRAPKLYYFDKYKPGVEKLIATAQLP
jgi:hypothetical protein